MAVPKWLKEFGVRDEVTRFFWILAFFLAVFIPVAFSVNVRICFAVLFVVLCVATLLKGKPLMRSRTSRTFLGSVIGNYMVIAADIVIAWLYKPSTEYILGEILVAIYVFSIFEICRPIYGTGVLSLFLSLPLKNTVACYGPHFNLWYPITIFLLIICIFWHEYYNLVYYEKMPDDKEAGGSTEVELQVYSNPQDGEEVGQDAYLENVER